MKFDLDNVSFVPGTETEQKGFCKIWPEGKMALQAMELIIKNPIVKFVLGLIITLGDRIEEKFCE